MSAPMKTMALRGARQASSVLRSCPRAGFSTLPAAHTAPATTTRLMPKTFALVPQTLAIPARATSIASTARFFSSTTPNHNAAATSNSGSSRAAAAAASSATPSTAALDWNSFFQLRVKRRRIQMVFSLVSGILGGAAGAIVLSSGAADTLVTMVPLDPFVTLGIATLCAGGMGWLIGPSLGSQVFYLLNRRYKTQMLQKESEFLTRVKKHRSDPANSSTSNPVPDFYGEKISSVAGYRRWLKDQRAFNRKKNANFV